MCSQGRCGAHLVKGTHHLPHPRPIARLVGPAPRYQQEQRLRAALLCDTQVLSQHGLCKIYRDVPTARATINAALEHLRTCRRAGSGCC